MFKFPGDVPKFWSHKLNDERRARIFEEVYTYKEYQRCFRSSGDRRWLCCNWKRKIPPVRCTGEILWRIQICSPYYERMSDSLQCRIHHAHWIPLLRSCQRGEPRIAILFKSKRNVELFLLAAAPTISECRAHWQVAQRYHVWSNIEESESKDYWEKVIRT